MFADADRVQLQRLGGQMLEGVDVDLVLRLRDGRGDGLRAELQPVGAARAACGSSAIQTIVASNWSATSGGIVGGGEHVAAADSRPRRSSVRASPTGRRPRCARSPPKVTIRATRAAPARTAGRATASPGRTSPLAISPAEAAEIEVRAVDPLHRHAKRLRAAPRSRRPPRVSRCSSSAGPAYQGVSSRLRVDDIVAVERRNRDRR